MKAFDGFPAKVSYTALPKLFFSALLPQIDDVAELKVTLHILWVLHSKRYPKYVTYGELVNDRTLMDGIKNTSMSPAEALRRALELATSRGTFLHLAVEGDNGQEEVYFLNDDAGRQSISRIRSGQLVLQGVRVKSEPHMATEELPNIFVLYEQNIGMLAPLIAEELREAEKLYPASWIEEAFKEAVNLNKRSWRYIQRILERWAAEGKGDGKAGRDSKAENDPDKYIKGKYGHIVRR